MSPIYRSNELKSVESNRKAKSVSELLKKPFVKTVREEDGKY